MSERYREPKEDPKKSAMLPSALRDASEEEIDEYISEKLEKMRLAIDLSPAGRDPIRGEIAVACLHLALDPRIDQKEVRARSVALLNATKILGLDRDMHMVSVDANGIEVMIKKIREKARMGEDAAGTVISKRTREASRALHAGQEVLLCEPPACD